MSQLLIRGKWVDGESTQTLTEKFQGRVYGQMAVASATQVDEAVTGALAGVQASSLSPYERFQILAQAARLTEGLGFISRALLHFEHRRLARCLTSWRHTTADLATMRIDDEEPQWLHEAQNVLEQTSSAGSPVPFSPSLLPFSPSPLLQSPFSCT
jgi:hypothetical protein